MNEIATLPVDDADLALWDELLQLREAVAAEAATRVAAMGDAGDPALANLGQYLALRHRDLRPLQRRLMWRGLSSLGRLEGRVLPTIDAALAAFSARLGRLPPFPAPTEAEYFAGEMRLHEATLQLFGPQAGSRATRIMVTLPSEAATDPAIIESYVAAGMDLARINCAHDDKEAWRAMSSLVRAAAERHGRRIPVLMDIAGPKIRTGKVEPKDARLAIGDALRLQSNGPLHTGHGVAAAAQVDMPNIVERLVVGDRVLYNDGKLEAVVESIGDGEAILRVTRTKGGGVKLRSEKGLNLPGTALGLSALTSKDEEDIDTLVGCADLIGYSFVSRPEDLDILEDLLQRRGGMPALGLVAKIERPEAISNLPELIARAAAKRPFGIMIARGDLAVEIGFERLAEMQEEILWICEAASIPAIWATQVLEGLVSGGIPSRAEMTDAAMSVRAECVMLNKGPKLVEAIEVLDRLLARMDDHMTKKTSLLRALKSW